ncbi:hypothetical protein M514_09938 [Trichuris suis]|uniref:Uncharacterized protein n=1 Tax=Trichuris suis TaxID=68888 RepID=A0A085LW70_9BILA|nr:hypothetical protein M513_09938 [Trichuris suis]KFD64304.1 hypothetical protein M514_09938 [Trichuris suis]
MWGRVGNLERFLFSLAFGDRCCNPGICGGIRYCGRCLCASQASSFRSLNSPRVQRPVYSRCQEWHFLSCLTLWVAQSGYRKYFRWPPPFSEKTAH